MKPRSRRYIADQKHDYKESFQLHSDNPNLKIGKVVLNRRKRAYKVTVSGQRADFKLSMVPSAELFKEPFYTEQPQDVTILGGIPYKTTTLEIKGND